MRYLIILILLFGCVGPKDYQIGDRYVTKKKYDRELDRTTRRYVKSASKEDLLIFLQMSVVVDTSTKD